MVINRTKTILKGKSGALNSCTWKQKLKTNELDVQMAKGT